jgi:hypothetical protein
MKTLSLTLFALLLAAQNRTFEVKPADLAGLPHTAVKVGDTEYQAVTMQAFLEHNGVSFAREARKQTRTGYVMVTAGDGYQVLYSLGEIAPDMGHARIYLADDKGEVRVLVPDDKEQARGVHNVVRMEVVPGK